MKKLILALLLCAASFGCYAPPAQLTETKIFTPQQRASHLITFLDKEGQDWALCSATAVGKHAFITATHCNEDEQSTVVTFDHSVRKYNLLAVADDGHDHSIYLVDGPAFTYLANYNTAAQRIPAIGEVVFYYGCGGGHYPPEEKRGPRVASSILSDVDEDMQFEEFKIESISGDSGAAIYDLKGNMISMVTYRLRSGTTGAFALAFTAEQVRYAQEFSLQ